MQKAPRKPEQRPSLCFCCRNPSRPPYCGLGRLLAILMNPLSVIPPRQRRRRGAVPLWPQPTCPSTHRCSHDQCLVRRADVVSGGSSPPLHNRRGSGLRAGMAWIDRNAAGAAWNTITSRTALVWSAIADDTAGSEDDLGQARAAATRRLVPGRPLLPSDCDRSRYEAGTHPPTASAPGR